MAQLRDHEGIQSKRDYFMVDPCKLTVDPGYNVRDLTTPESRAHIEFLKASIATSGVRVPLEARLSGDDIVVTAGHCRLAAVLELIADGIEIKTVPVMPEPKGTGEDERTLNLVLSNGGKPLAPLEVAKVVKRLCDFGWPEAEIQRRMGWRSVASVKQHLDMLEMPAEVQQMVRQGEVSATTAVNEVRRNGHKATDTLRTARDVAKADGRTKVTARTIRETTGEAPRIPRAVQSGIAELIKALEPFAQIAELNDLAEIAEDGMIEVSVADIKRAARVHAKAVGGVDG